MLWHKRNECHFRRTKDPERRDRVLVFTAHASRYVHTSPADLIEPSRQSPRDIARRDDRANEWNSDLATMRMSSKTQIDRQILDIHDVVGRVAHEYRELIVRRAFMPSLHISSHLIQSHAISSYLI